MRSTGDCSRQVLGGVGGSMLARFMRPRDPAAVCGPRLRSIGSENEPTDSAAGWADERSADGLAEPGREEMQDDSVAEKERTFCTDRDCEPLIHRGNAKSPEDSLGMWPRDLVACVLGALAGLAVFFISCLFHLLNRAGDGTPNCPGLGGLSDLNMSTLLHVNKTMGHSYAFVTMAHDPPGEPTRTIFQVLALAHALQRLSAFPLVVLTNTTHFPDGTAVSKAVGHLNAQIFPVYDIPLAEEVERSLSSSQRRFSYWRLQVWRLTQFEKLIWLDADSILVRSVDWLFERKPMWAQKYSSSCDPADDEENPSTGLMLIEPSEDTFEGLQQHARVNPHYWIQQGDHMLIGSYFAEKVKRPVRLLDLGDASFGSCLGRTPGLPYNSTGPWSLPAFVHKSSVHNECFDFNIARQEASVQGEVVNICSYHPLGPYWRNHFCKAVHSLGILTNATEVFCDDIHWYRMR